MRAVATTRLYELNNSRAPAVLVELAYHDNASDAEWIKSNLPQIARNLSLSVAEYFGLVLAEPSAVPNATAVTQGGRLNIREAPDISAVILGQIPNGARITVNGQQGEWYLVNYNGINGYSYGEYIRFD